MVAELEELTVMSPTAPELMMVVATAKLPMFAMLTSTPVPASGTSFVVDLRFNEWWPVLRPEKLTSANRSGVSLTYLFHEAHEAVARCIRRLPAKPDGMHRDCNNLDREALRKRAMVDGRQRTGHAEGRAAGQ